MSDTKRVRATANGYAPRYPGGECERIREGTEFVVSSKTTGTWFEDLDPAPKAKGKAVEAGKATAE